MMRILFLVLCVVLVPRSQAQGSIEIYANGHKYDSLQAYKISETPLINQSTATPASLDHQQEDYVLQESKQLGIDVDFSKVKTLQVGGDKISGITMHKLYVLSVENGMVGALRDFYQTWGQSDIQMAPTISSEQLQEVIQEEVTSSKAPKLLISDPGKVRIMTLTPQDSPK